MRVCVGPPKTLTPALSRSTGRGRKKTARHHNSHPRRPAPPCRRLRPGLAPIHGDAVVRIFGRLALVRFRRINWCGLRRRRALLRNPPVFSRGIIPPLRLPSRLAVCRFRFKWSRRLGFNQSAASPDACASFMLPDAELTGATGRRMYVCGRLRRPRRRTRTGREADVTSTQRKPNSSRDATAPARTWLMT